MYWARWRALESRRSSKSSSLRLVTTSTIELFVEAATGAIVDCYIAAAANLDKPVLPSLPRVGEFSSLLLLRLLVRLELIMAIELSSSSTITLRV